MNAEQLFTKIGILTVENDMLRAELNRAKERIEELERRLEDALQPKVEGKPSKE